MAQESPLVFGPFRLESSPARLWRGSDVIDLRPRALAVLWYLVRHPGRLVTKAELRQQVWEGTHVTDTVLRVCVREIRAALGDVAATPQYLATITPHGWQFLVPVEGSPPPPEAVEAIVVGRQAEVEALAEWFQRAASGARQLVFVSGEAGIGKTTVVEQWLARLPAGSPVRCGRGQCVEQYGEGEPYLPVLEALSQLGRGPEGPTLLAVLRRYAPMWLAQLPGLASDPELERVQRQVQGATQARMLRELAEALAVLTADTPLVLLLEDLHWSDHATLECLAALAQRREPARLLVVGTYRPVEMLLRGPLLRGLAQELIGRGYGVELPLELLLAGDVTAYVAQRLGGPVASSLAAFVHERTEGNALFMVNLLEHLVQQGLVAWQGEQWTLRPEVPAAGSLPAGVRQLIVRRIEALPGDTQRVLEAASVVGEAFAAAAVAAGAQCTVADVEAVCDALVVQQHFLDDSGLTAWPDGTRGGSYGFRHMLYQQVLYERLGTTRRMQLHRRIGGRLETAYGARAGELAAQLALHFERGGETSQAILYWQQAGDNAARRHAYHDAIALFTKGLVLLATLPDTPERAPHELSVQLALGELLRATQGVGAPDVGKVYSRAYTLCQQIGETPLFARVLWGLSQFQMTHGQGTTAGELAQQLLDLAQQQPDTGYLMEGHFLLGTMAFYRGHFLAARTHLEQSWRLADTEPSSAATLRGGFVRGVTPRTSLARVLWTLGYADQAQQRSQEALALAQQGEHLPSLAYAECFVGLVCQCRRDMAETQVHAEALLALATAQQWPLRAAQGRIVQGWVLAMQGDAAAGVVQLRQGVESPDVGPEHLRPYWLALLAEAYGRAGQPEVGLQVLAEAVAVMTTTEMWWSEAEMSRLQGELQLQLACPDIPQAEACFQRSLTVARRQQAKSLELRAALSLARLWQQQGQRQAALTLLAPVYGWFTEGFDTADLQEAQALLASLM